MVKSFEDLIVWQKAMDLVVEVYSIIHLLPASELYSLSKQIQRAAVSIPSNIAEGRSRSTRKDFAHFLHISLGSCSELKTQLLISVRLKYVPIENISQSLSIITEVAKMLNAMISRLESNS